MTDCDHEWKLIDDSFDHEYGTEQIVFYRCQLCDAEHEYDDEPNELDHSWPHRI